MARKPLAHSSILQLGGDRFSPGPFVSQLIGPLPIFVFSYSPEHDTLLHWSNNGRQVLGTSEAALIGPGNFLLRDVHIDDRFHTLEAFEKACLQSTPLLCSYRWVRPDTRELRTLLCIAGWHKYRISQNGSGELRALEGLIIDLAAALPSLQEILQSSSSQELFEKSHEVALARSVLQHLENHFSTLETLVEQIPLVSGAKRRLSELSETIERSCESARSILRKLTQRQEPPSRVLLPVDLTATVLDCLNRYSSEGHEQVTVTFAPTSVSPVLANPQRLSDALTQLLGCFDHFIHESSSGAVHLRLGELQAGEGSKQSPYPGSWVTLAITLEDAPALPSAEKLVLDETQLPLEKLLQIRAREACQILEGCGAKLHFASEPKITLVVYFPSFSLEKEEDPTANPNLRALDTTTSVLVVERDELVAKTLVAGLQEVGFKAAAFEAYSGALDFAASHAAEIRLVIFELGQNADQFLREIRLQNPYIHSIAILPAETAHESGISDIQNWLGCTATLAKPFNLLELKNILSQLPAEETNALVKSSAQVVGLS